MILHLHHAVSFLDTELLQSVLLFLFINRVYVRETESRISSMHRVCNEYKFITEVLDSSFPETSDSIHGSGFVSLEFGHVARRLLILFAYLEELHDVRHDNQVASEDSSVSWLCRVHNLASENDIHRSGHGTCGDISGMLLDSEFLPIDEGTVGVHDLPLRPVHAILVHASDRLSEFKLLLHVLTDFAALLAFECA